MFFLFLQIQIHNIVVESASMLQIQIQLFVFLAGNVFLIFWSTPKEETNIAKRNVGQHPVTGHRRKHLDPTMINVKSNINVFRHKFEWASRFKCKKTIHRVPYWWQQTQKPAYSSILEITEKDKLVAPLVLDWPIAKTCSEALWLIESCSNSPYDIKIFCQNIASVSAPVIMQTPRVWPFSPT